MIKREFYIRNISCNLRRLEVKVSKTRQEFQIVAFLIHFTLFSTSPQSQFADFVRFNDISDDLLHFDRVFYL